MALSEAVKKRASRKITRGLRFRLTLSYALFFTLLLTGVGMSFRQILSASLNQNVRDVLDQEWAALKGYLKIEKGKPIWFYDRQDPDETFIVSRLQRIYLLTDAHGKQIEASELYRAMGDDSAAEIRAVIHSQQPHWRVRENPHGGEVQIRAGVIYSEDKKHEPFYVAIGRSLSENRRVVNQFTRFYLGLLPVMIFASCLLGWLLAGRALRPVTEVARTAQGISGSNLSLRIPARGAGDELDDLIETFNRMVERLESSFQQIRQFSTDVSHELRTPITCIRGQLEVALFTAKDAEQYREAIVNSLQDIERLSQLVRALLLLAQAESGQVTLQKNPFDLAAAARNMLDQFQLPADEAGVRLIADLPEECFVELDRVQIERMLSNLVSNALKFTPAGGQVRVALRCPDSGLELIVEDTGRGISEEHLPRIFDRFYRIPSSEPAPERGLGLGLSFVAWIVKAHGGTVEVDSRAGKGTRFTIWLPATAAPVRQPLPVEPTEAGVTSR